MKFRVFTISILLMILVSQIYAQAPKIENQKSVNSTFGSRTYFPIRRKATKEQKKQLQPRAEDLAAYAQILRQPKTGIFRLMPDLECEKNTLVIKADETCLKAIPGSSFYSFREREHTQEVLADIRLKNNYLISDGILSQGIMVNLGDVALENVTTESEGLKFLNDYVPQVFKNEAQKQFMQMVKGVKSGRYEYTKIVPAVENRTYGLRVIAYKGIVIRAYRGFRFDLLAGDKRTDITLAFRVVRKDKDDGLTLVWKELSRRESPKIKLEKRKIRYNYER
jgi:hypothetical protein